jgi:hypothetical protein
VAGLLLPPIKLQFSYTLLRGIDWGGNGLLLEPTMNNPMRDRRAALDLAIQALDFYKRDKLIWMSNEDNKQKFTDKVNKSIQILTAMREEGPLL